jgi:phosphopantetheine--protein transferase-like protein
LFKPNSNITTFAQYTPSSHLRPQLQNDKLVQSPVKLHINIHNLNNMKIRSTIGIGVDIINTNRFRLLFEKKTSFVDRLSKRILHPSHELPRFQSLYKSNVDESIRFIAGSWSIKEALFKTLDPDEQEKFNFNHWYKSYNSNGKPFVSNDNYNCDESFLVSVSHDHEMLVANVLRQKEITLE